MERRYCYNCRALRDVHRERQIHGRFVTIENYCRVCLHTWWTDGTGKLVGKFLYSYQTLSYYDWRRY